MKHGLLKTALAAGALLAAGCSPLLAQEQEGTVPTTVLVNVQGSHQTQLPVSALTLQVNGRKTPIQAIQPAIPSGVEVAILIDDGLRGSVALRLQDLVKFIPTLPPNVKVLVGYMQNGTVRSQGQGFSANHEAVARQVRIPMSSPGMSASPYFCLSDFVKHWPSQDRAARVVLMITNGVDPYNGSTSILNQDSPYVQAAQDNAQRAGVAVYALYYGDAGMGGFRTSFSGQSYLSQVAEATGGESLYNGTIAPPSFTPYLEQFGRDLEKSYLIGFQTSRQGEHDSLVRIKVRSNESGLKVRAPENVHPGVDE